MVNQYLINGYQWLLLVIGCIIAIAILVGDSVIFAKSPVFEPVLDAS